MKRNDVLFISHEATLTGAPMVLLTLLEWLRKNSDITFQTLLLKTGPLEDRFRSVGDVVTVDLHTQRPTLLERGLGTQPALQGWARTLQDRRLKRALSRLDDHRVTYVNSIFGLGVVPALPSASNGTRRKILCHVHELDFALNYFMGRAKHLFEPCDGFLAVSRKVVDSLIDFGIGADKIELCYEFISPDLIRTHANLESLRRELSIPADAPVVGGCGVIEWRKGPDIFLQMAQAVRGISTREPFFVWVGGHHEGWEYHTTLHTLQHCGVEPFTRLVPTTPDVQRYLQLFDIFCLTSREDPFPVAALEAAAHKKPIVCFSSSGISEFVGADCGAHVPHLDVGAMAEEVSRLLEDDALRDSYGERAAEKVLAQHTVEQAGPALLRVIRSALEE